jgi:proteic killer suppression protein
LNLSFDNKNLRLICEDEIKAQEQLGTETAFKLKSRLADMRAADSVTDLVVGNPREILNQDNPAFKIDLSLDECIIFTPVHSKLPVLSDGKIDWHNVSRIKLISIGK